MDNKRTIIISPAAAHSATLEPDPQMMDVRLHRLRIIMIAIVIVWHGVCSLPTAYSQQEERS
jgi:hypothetical protein